MCDTLMFSNGCEVWSVGELRQLGLPVEEQWQDNSCLCVVDLPELIDKLKNKWIFGAFGYDEVGENGKTWHEGFQIKEVVNSVQYMYRPDGKSNMTFEEFVDQVKSGQIQLLR